MPIEYDRIIIPAPAGLIRGALLLPITTPPHATVVVLQEAFGFTQQILGVGRRLAGAGFAAVIPDLYSRDPRRLDLADRDVALGFPIFRQTDRESAFAALAPEDRASARKAVAWLDDRDPSQYFADSLASVRWARERPSLDRDRVAVLGFCMGGGLVGRIAASGTPIAAGVVFYGQIPSSQEIDRIRAPLLAHHAETDPSITPKVPEFAKALARLDVPFSWTVHPGTAHGFFNETRPAYDHDAASTAWASTLEFLGEALRPGQRSD
jgi:carboxymethylenebutenolidase